MAESLTPSTPGTFGRDNNGGGFDIWSWLKEHLLHGGAQPGGDPSDPENMAAEKAKVVAEYAKKGASPNQDAAPMGGMSPEVLSRAASRTPTQYQHGNPGGSVAADDPQPSMVRALWDKANTPLVPQIQEGWDQLANLVDPAPTLEDSKHPQLSQLKGMLAGSMQGLGGVAASLTSPLGIGSSALGGAGFAALRNAAARQAAKTAGSVSSKQAAALADYLAQNKNQLASEFSTADSIVPPSPRTPLPDPQEAAYARIMRNR